jgi:hypothetical protein
MGNLAMWAAQFEALTKKNIETFRMRKTLLGTLLIIPLIGPFLFAWLQGMEFDRVQDQRFPDEMILSELRPCLVFNSLGQALDTEPCVRLAFAGADDATREVSKDIARDIDPGAEEYSSISDLASAIYQRPGRIDAALVVKEKTSTSFKYALWKNATAEASHYPGTGDFHHYLPLQVAIEARATAQEIDARIRKFSIVDQVEKAEDVRTICRPLTTSWERCFSSSG